MPEANHFRRCFLAIEHKAHSYTMHMPLSFQIASNPYSKTYHSLTLKEIYLNSKLLKAEISRKFLCISWGEVFTYLLNSEDKEFQRPSFLLEELIFTIDTEYLLY